MRCFTIFQNLLQFEHKALFLKGQGHVTVKTLVISIIYVVAHTLPLRSVQILAEGVNPQECYSRKSTNISAVVQHMSVSFVSL